MIDRRAFLISAALVAGCRPALSLPRGGRDLGPDPPPRPRDGRLRRKAEQFESAMEHHLTPDGLVLTERLIDPDPADPLNAQDAAIWTGCYVAAEACRWLVTRDPGARARLDRSLRGLHLLQDATGVPGVLARMVKRAPAPVPGETPAWHQGVGDMAAYRWMGDVSVDQYAGVFFGYAAAHEAVEDAATRAAIADRVGRLVDRLIDRGWRIVDADGRPTKHSDLSGGLLTEPLNALLALAFAKVAARVTDEPRFAEAYRVLTARGYARTAAVARDKWWEYLFGVNHSDNNLAYLGYYPLIRLEDDPGLLDQYRKGVTRAWRVVRVEGNPLFAFITQAVEAPGWRDDEALARAVDTLARFPFPKRDEIVRNSLRRGICRSWFDDRLGHPQACAPLPVDERPRSSFEWSSNPYRMDRMGDPRVALAGVDYLLAYWLGRRHGILSDAD